VPISTEDLRAQLSEAKGQILRLKQQAEDQVLRQRKSDAVNQDSRERITTGTTGMGIQQQPADGVPVQIVAALCLLSFLLAYFFFWSVGLRSCAFAEFGAIGAMTVGRGVREQVKRVSGVSLGRTGSGGNPSSAAMEL